MIILASLVGGAGNSIIWVAHGSYISQCASESNKGAFNGFFWIILQAAMIIGNSLGSVLDQNLGQAMFYTILAIIGFIGSFFFLGLRNPTEIITRS